MKKYTLIFFVFSFILGLFIFNIVVNAQGTNLPNCSSISGYKLIRGQSCTVSTKTLAVFNFRAKSPDKSNLSWSINWGDNKGLSKVCPSLYPNTNFNISHLWESAGTYKVTLGVSDCKGGEAQASFNVVVKDVVSSPIILPPPVLVPEVPNIDDIIFPGVISDIVVPSQNWPDKVSWLNAIWLPNLKFEIKNTGVKNFSYTLSYGDGEEYTTPASYGGDNWKKGSSALNIGFSTKSCGPRKVKVTLNPDKKVAETDYSNNSFEKIIDVDCTKAPYDFDMTIEKVGVWPTTSIQGKTVGLNARFFNIGKEEDVRFSHLYHGYNKNPKLPGHGAVCLYRTDSTGTHEMSCPATVYSNSNFGIVDQPICGNNHYVMKVDGYNDVLETNENNNETSGDVFVDCSQKPDFVIEKVGTWPTTVKSGTKPLLYFVEKNIGQTTAGRAGVVRMTVNNLYRAGSWSFQSLSPGSSIQMLFGYQQSGSIQSDNDWWIPSCNRGDKFVLNICADNACGWSSSEIDESNESNNVLTHEVTCE